MEVKKDTRKATSSGIAGKASIPGTEKCMSLYLHVENLPVSGLAQLPEILLALFPLFPAASSVCPWQNRRCGPVPGQIGNGEWHDPLIPSLPAMLRNASVRIPELGSRRGSGGGPNPYLHVEDPAVLVAGKGGQCGVDWWTRARTEFSAAFQHIETLKLINKISQ
ncbi:MAG: hypothetical protein QGG48_04030 [Desulfatiglandales bacterium]|jgi:hypothetical protein|nr:hypothetical protein [Desulfatiglandales bacterium]